MPIVRQIISVGMTRLYTYWLGTAGYGVKEVADLWLIALQQLLGQNVLTAMVRFYFDHRDERERASVVTSVTILVTIFAFALCGFALLFSQSLAPLMLGQGEQVPASELHQILQLLLVLIPFQLATVSGFQYLRIRELSTLFAKIQLAKLLFEVGLHFWLIGHEGLGVRGFLLATLAGEVLTSLGLTGWMLIKLRPRIEWSIIKPILLYAAPLVPVGLCQFGLHQVDRRLLLLLAEPGTAQQVTGIYGLGYKLGYMVNSMVLAPFLLTWQPWIFGVEDPAERARYVARVSTWTLLVVGAAALGASLFGREGVLILGGQPEFRVAHQVVPLVAAGYVFWGLYQATAIPLLIAKRTVRLFVINLLALIANLGLNFALIPAYGFIGAGIATLVTFAFLAVLGVFASRSEAQVPFEIGRIATILAIVLTGGGVALWFDHHVPAAGWSSLVLMGTKAIVLVALLSAGWLAVLRSDERRSLTRYVRGRLGRKPS